MNLLNSLSKIPSRFQEWRHPKPVPEPLSDAQVLDSIHNENDYHTHRARLLAMDSHTVSNGRTPLTAMIQDAPLEDIQELISKGADVNFPLDYPPLHSAVRWERADLIPVLVDAGANLNAQNARGNTPLHIAGYQPIKRKKELIALLNAGADVTVLNKDEFTPFEMTYKHKYDEECLRELIKAGSLFDTYLSSKEDYQYLHHAAQFGRKDALNEFLYRGANHWGKDKYRELPIETAERKRNVKCFSILAMWKSGPTFEEAVFFERGKDNAFIQKEGKPLEITLLRDSKTNNLYRQESHIRVAIKVAFAFILTPLFVLGGATQSLLSIVTDLGSILKNLPTLYRKEGIKELLTRTSLDIPKALISRVFEAVSTPFKAIGIWGASVYALYDPNRGRKWINDVWGEGKWMNLTGLAPVGNLSNSLINGRTKFYLNKWK